MDRSVQIQQWLDSLSADTYEGLAPASADASFRRYYRVNDRRDGSSRIIMDAPPEHENCRPFVHVTELLRSVGVNAPDIIALDINQGFLLLDDLGETPYLDILDDNSAEKLYLDALDARDHVFNDLRDLGLYNLRGGPAVGGFDGNHRRLDVRVLPHRQLA